MLTDIEIRNLPTPSRRKTILVNPANGLRLLHQPSGSMSFAVWYWLNGVQKKFTIGSYPAVTLKAANKKAWEVKGAAAGGKDPAAEKKAARQAGKAQHIARDRVAEVVEGFIIVGYLAKLQGRHGPSHDTGFARRGIVSRFGSRRLGDIKDVEVHAMNKEIAERAPSMSNQTFAVFRTMCRWAKTLDGGELRRRSRPATA